MEEIRSCIDVALSWEEQIEAAKLAREEREGNAYKAGDVVSDALKAGFNADALSAVLLTNKKWQNGRLLNIGFYGGSTSLQQRCMALFKQWEIYANIQMVHIDSVADAHIRVSFERGGSWSYVGTDCLLIPRDKPTMQLGWASDNTTDQELQRVCVHEMGHTLGLGHEHQHPEAGIPWDREKVYQWYTANAGWTREDVDYQVFRLMTVNQTNFSKYDPASIMHYPIPAQLLTDPSKAVGWNTQLSMLDKAFASEVYPKPGGYKVGVQRRALTNALRYRNEPFVGTYKGEEFGHYEPKGKR